MIFPSTNSPQFLGKGPVNQFGVVETFPSGLHPVYPTFAPPVTSTGKGPIYVDPNAGHIA